MTERYGPLHFPQGLTIADLKVIVKDLPETDERGEPFEVWFEIPKGNHRCYGISRIVKEVSPLNKGDLLLG